MVLSSEHQPGKASMHILSIIRHPVGGIRSYLRYNYSKLDPSVYRVTVATVAYPEAYLLTEGMAPVQADLELVPRKRAFWELTRRTRKIIRTRSFDLVHAQGLTAAVIGMLCDTARRLPHVVTLHETFRPDQFSWPLGGLKKRLLARALARADRIIVVGNDALDNLEEFIPLSAGARERTEVIRNGVAVDRLLKDAEEYTASIRDTLGTEAGAVLVGFVGRFMPEKGVDVLIDAVHRLTATPGTLPTFKVIAVNDGAYIREYKQQIEERGLARYFAFPGFRPSIAGFLKELDVLVVPSLREAGPLVAAEAMVLGCPLIASDCVGLREVTRDSPALVSKAGDAASLAEALRRVISAPQQWQESAAEYAPAARRAFDSENAAQRLQAVFRSVASPAR